MKALALLLCLVFAGACADSLPDYAAAHRTTLYLDFGNSSCSGTAVAPHVLLGAAHCFSDNPKAFKVNGQSVTFYSLISDGQDHVLVNFTGPAFTHFAKISAAKIEQGSRVFVIGNPGELQDMLRTGEYSGSRQEDDALLFNLNGWHGDSGAAIFNRYGQIVTTVSFGDSQNTDYPDEGVFRMLGGYPLAFTHDQLKAAGI